MTVRRVGPAHDTAHRTDLGCVLVTIDDLAVLMMFLTRSMAGIAAKINVEFDGGYFTEAEELRTLSDMELKSLRLKTQRVEVVLNPSAAFAVGERQEAEDVYRIWARARQTRLRPRPIQLSDTLKYIPILVGGPLGLLFTSVMFLSDTSSDAPPRSIVISVVTGGFVALLLICAFLWRTDRARESSYAVVVPLSLAEHRQSRSSQVYPRRSWIVAIVTAIIAAVAVGVAVWAVLSP